jgi:putative acetyltransferase
LSRSFRIRPFRPADGAALADLHRKAILATSDAYYTGPERDSWAAGLKPEFYVASEEGSIELAVDPKDRPIAFCQCAGDEVLGLYVHPDWQRYGVGRALMQRAEARMASAGHRAVRVHASNSAVPFYEGLGYAVVEATSHKTRGGLVLASTRLTKPLG